MKSIELRIGNIVDLDGKITIVTADLIKKLDSAEFIGFDTSTLKPIPITIDLLYKFDKCPTVKEWKGNSQDYQPKTSKTKQIIFNTNIKELFIIYQIWSYRKSGNDDWIDENSIFIIYNWDNISIVKEELHFLQNLIFFLTGNELKIDL